MRFAACFALLATVVPLAVRAEGFWLGTAICEYGECEESQCTTEWETLEFISENEPGCSEFYNAQIDSNWDWAAGERPSKFTEILCGHYIDFYYTGNGYDFYYSGGDGTKLGSCYYDTGSVNGGCPFGSGSCAVQGVMYCDSSVQIC